MDKETYIKRVEELEHIKQRALEYNSKERAKAVESYITSNCSFKIGEEVIFFCNRRGKIEKIYANDDGAFWYDVRPIKKNGEPANQKIHVMPWEHIEKA